MSESNETSIILNPTKEESQGHKVDLLTEDPPLPGQKYGVYSFMSKDKVKGCKVDAFKPRGSFDTIEEASEYAKKLRDSEPAFNVFVGENFKWVAFDPNPEMVKDNANYYEDQLQSLMKGTLENHEKTKQLESQRKQDMIKQSVLEEINKKKQKKNTREKLKEKINKKQMKKSAEESLKKDESKVNQVNEEEVKEVEKEVKTIDEGINSLKNLLSQLK